MISILNNACHDGTRCGFLPQPLVKAGRDAHGRLDQFLLDVDLARLMRCVRGEPAQGFFLPGDVPAPSKPPRHNEETPTVCPLPLAGPPGSPDFSGHISSQAVGEAVEAAALASRPPASEAGKAGSCKVAAGPISPAHGLRAGEGFLTVPQAVQWSQP